MAGKVCKVTIVTVYFSFIAIYIIQSSWQGGDPLGYFKVGEPICLHTVAWVIPQLLFCQLYVPP